MELLLNALWLLLSSAATVAWFSGNHAAVREPQYRCARGLLALGCVLVMLFPMVSISDDLQYEQIAIEDSKPHQKSIKPAHYGKVTLHDHHAPAVMLLGSATNSLADPLGFLITELQPTMEVITIAHILGRAPPSLS